MINYLILFIILIFIPFQSKAEEPQGVEMLTQLEEKLRRHPEITAYSSRVEASGNYAKSELGLPDPMLFIERENYRFRSDMGRGGGDTMLGFRQEIPRSGLREARAARLREESRKHRLLQDYAFSSMRAKMLSSFVNLRKIKKLKEISLEQEKLLALQKKSLEGSIAANRASAGTVLMADADLQEIHIMLTELEEEQHEIEAMLVNMLGEPFNPAWLDMTLPPIEIATWNNDAAHTYPVIIATSDIDMAKRDVDIREAEYGPNFEIQGSAGNMDDGDGGGTIMLGVSIPLWAAESQKPRLLGAKASLSAAEFDHHDVKRQMIERLNHLKAQIDTSSRKIELFEKKESLLQEAADTISREYEAGKADFSMILKTRREAFSVRALAEKERAKHTTLIADFNRYIVQENRHE